MAPRPEVFIHLYSVYLRLFMHLYFVHAAVLYPDVKYCWGEENHHSQLSFSAVVLLQGKLCSLLGPFHLCCWQEPAPRAAV